MFMFLPQFLAGNIRSAREISDFQRRMICIVRFSLFSIGLSNFAHVRPVLSHYSISLGACDASGNMRSSTGGVCRRHSKKGGKI